MPVSRDYQRPIARGLTMLLILLVTGTAHGEGKGGDEGDQPFSSVLGPVVPGESVDPTTIAEACVTAMGGAAAFEALHSIGFVATTTINFQSGPKTFSSKVITQFPSKTVEVPFDDGEPISLFDGKDLFTIEGSTITKGSEELAVATKKSLATDVFVLLPTIAQPGVTLDYGGTTTLEGKPVDIVDVLLADGSKHRFFVDTETKLLRGEYHEHLGAPMLNIFKDYKGLGGIVIPVGGTSYFGKGSTTYTLKDIVVNPALSEATFVPSTYVKQEDESAR